MTIKAVFFDFDGTIRLSRVSSGEIFYRFVSDLGCAVTEEDRRRAGRWEHYYWAQSAELLRDVEALTFGTEAFWRRYARRRLAALGLPPPLAEAWAEEASQYMRAHYRPGSVLPPCLPETLADLKARGYVLGIFSNRREAYDHEVSALGLTDYFDHMVVAGDLQSWKPEVAGFHHLLNLAGVAPQESVYVGDNYFADVVGARRAGMFPVLYNVRGLFEDVNCATIVRYDQLLPLLEEI